MSMFTGQISGHLGQDPEQISYTKDGETKTFVTISIAHTVGRKTDREKTIWVKGIIRGGLQDVFLEWFHKGDKVVVNGDVSTEEWDDKDGVHQTRIAINVSSFDFGGSASGNGENTGKAKDADLPF